MSKLTLQQIGAMVGTLLLIGSVLGGVSIVLAQDGSGDGDGVDLPPPSNDPDASDPYDCGDFETVEQLRAYYDPADDVSDLDENADTEEEDDKIACETDFPNQEPYDAPSNETPTNNTTDETPTNETTTEEPTNETTTEEPPADEEMMKDDEKKDDEKMKDDKKQDKEMKNDDEKKDDEKMKEDEEMKKDEMKDTEDCPEEEHKEDCPEKEPPKEQPPC
jgi:hypothetical protein